jgi:hypothetical protein
VGTFRQYLTSRKNLVGMGGAVVGLGLNLAGVVGDIWPAVAVGLYAAGALLTPPDPRAAPPLTTQLREEADELDARIAKRPLPDGALPAVRRILAATRTVLTRLDQVNDDPAARAAAPERLASVAEIVRIDLPACLDAYLRRAPTAAAAAELATQLDLIAAVADKLAAEVPDADVQRAEDLTRELRKRYPPP